MQEGRPSLTAAFVAAMRGLGVLLPPPGRLIDDPWGAQWTGVERLRRMGEAAPRLAGWLGWPVWSWLLHMQIRTYALDQAVEAFARDGGRQLVLLGAGLDARALRLKGLGLRVFEVDHPATQAWKRTLAGDAGTLVPWDFEHEPLRGLPARLASLGFRQEERACVIWEGVIMYLPEAAVEETVAMLRQLLSAGSVLAFTYDPLGTIHQSRLQDWVKKRLMARIGEPWKFGWEPASLPSWLEARGFGLRSHDTAAGLGARWLPPALAKRLRDDPRRIAVAVRAGAP